MALGQTYTVGGEDARIRGQIRRGQRMGADVTGLQRQLGSRLQARTSNIGSADANRDEEDLLRGMSNELMMGEREGRGMIAEGRQSLLDQPVGGRLVSQFAPGMSEIDKSRQVAAQGGFGRGAQLREDRRQFDASPQGQVQQTQGIIAEGRRIAGLGENAPQDQLKQRQALFAEMSDAKTLQQLAAFRERATALGVDNAGWKRATGRLDQMRGGPLAQMERELNGAGA